MKGQDAKSELREIAARMAADALDEGVTPEEALDRAEESLLNLVPAPPHGAPAGV